MTWSYDLSTKIGQVRLLVMDRTEAKTIFSDEEIGAFLTTEGEVVKRAAALSKETIAGNQVLLLKTISLLDLSTDGAAVARELRLEAGELRSQANDEDMDDVTVIELELNDASIHEQIDNQRMRSV